MTKTMMRLTMGHAGISGREMDGMTKATFVRNMHGKIGSKTTPVDAQEVSIMHAKMMR